MIEQWMRIQAIRKNQSQGQSLTVSDLSKKSVLSISATSECS